MDRLAEGALESVLRFLYKAIYYLNQCKSSLRGAKAPLFYILHPLLCGGIEKGSLRGAKPLFFNIPSPSPFRERGIKGVRVDRHP